MGSWLELVVTYLDSSGIVRVCLREGDTTVVSTALDASPIASVLAWVEVPIAISTRFHRGVIDEGQLERLNELATSILRRVQLLEMNDDMIQEAVRVGARFRVRSMDAIHLATAVVAARQQTRWGNHVRFCTADVRQSQAAEALLGAARVDLIEPL